MGRLSWRSPTESDDTPTHMAARTKLELTWIGKDVRPRLEPRILLDDPDLSALAETRRPGDLFDNRLIHGDNLLALKALEAEFTGAVKCVCIDPPYNTGSAFTHYDDGVEHSVWLSLMRDRLEIMRRLLADDGSLWVFADDSEAHYLKVMLDELFGRNCFVASVLWKSADSSNNDAKQLSVDHNYILVYSRTIGWLANSLPRTEEDNKHYKNPDNDPRGKWFSGNVSSPNPRENLRYKIRAPNGRDIDPPSNGWRWSKETVADKIESGEIVFSDDGLRIVRKTYLYKQGGVSPSTVWDDVKMTGHNRQAKYELKKLFPDVRTSDLFATPKPERVIERILTIATDPGDLVLDSFLGSGTTAAVAHKMGRRWIGVELGDHAVTHCVPRLRKVVAGKDAGGITEAAGWAGGGGFRFQRLAPSLLQKDAWGNWVVNPAYNAEMLAEALCRHEGFTYAPSQEHYWMHGRSTEQDFLYVTTQTLMPETLRALSDAVGPDRTLLVCCAAWRGEAPPNLTLKKIPRAVMNRCEWGRDDYSLNVATLPETEPDAPADDLPLFASAR